MVRGNKNHVEHDENNGKTPEDTTVMLANKLQLLAQDLQSGGMTPDKAMSMLDTIKAEVQERHDETKYAQTVFDRISEDVNKLECLLDDCKHNHGYAYMNAAIGVFLIDDIVGLIVNSKPCVSGMLMGNNHSNTRDDDLAWLEELREEYVKLLSYSTSNYVNWYALRNWLTDFGGMIVGDYQVFHKDSGVEIVNYHGELRFKFPGAPLR